MFNIIECYFKIGNDFCIMFDYLVLCDEFVKFFYFVCLDVNWGNVEKLVLNFFDINGVEFQIVVWYILVRV